MAVSQERLGVWLRENDDPPILFGRRNLLCMRGRISGVGVMGRGRRGAIRSLERPTYNQKPNEIVSQAFMRYDSTRVSSDMINIVFCTHTYRIGLQNQVHPDNSPSNAANLSARRKSHHL